MKKYNLYLKIALFIFISVILVACPNKPDECTWKTRTTKMFLDICKPYTYNIPHYECEELQNYDSCRYDSLRINISFESEVLPNQEVCSSPHDSLIGFIDNLVVICKNDYNSEYQSHNTINSIIDIIYLIPLGSHGKYEMTETPISLQSFLANNPTCTGGIYMFLNTPPDTTHLQQFIIIYEEDNGKKYQDTTKPIYIKP